MGRGMRWDVTAGRDANVAGRDLYVGGTHIHQPAPPRRDATLVVGDVPQEPPAFQHRDPLAAALARPDGPQVKVVYAVTGQRGVGKTQAAAAYARQRIADGWRLVAWADASTEATLLAGLADVATRAGIATPGDDVTALAKAVRHHLEADGTRRLLILDNANDLDLLRPYLPAAGEAQVIITSTRRPAATLGTHVEVDVFTEAQSVDFLTKRTALPVAPSTRALAAELGYLPLGLSQAAALIASEHISYETYLSRLKATTLDAYLTRPEADPYPHGVAEAIILSLQSVESRDPTGRCTALLGMLSLLSESGVPRPILHRAAAEDLLGEATSSDAEMDASLARLSDASLLAFTLDDVAQAHRLILRVTRERLTAAGHLPETAEGAMGLLAVMVDEISEAWRERAATRDLTGQIAALTAALAPHPEFVTDPLRQALLMFRGQSVYLLNELGDSASLAILAAEPLLADYERVLGPSHPDTLPTRNNLANAYRKAGRVADAISLHEQALTDRERILGPTHPDTLASRNNLAAAYLDAGRVADAITLYEQTLADREQALGRTHPDTLLSRSNLAVAYREAGRVADAISLHEQSLTDFERVLGPSHPDTLATQNSLASAYREAGRVADAISLHEQALTDRERILGPTHPDTLASRNDLAITYKDAGRAADAIPLLERNLTDRERVLGPDHPDMLQSQSNLAVAYREAGRTAEAIPLFEQALAGRERVLGRTHAGTLATQHNLALAYQGAGRAADAISLYERALTDLEGVLGPAHRTTRVFRDFLAEAYQAAGRAADAIPLYEQTLTDSERELGPAHPDTLSTQNNLANAYGGAGRVADAIPLYELALSGTERVLGADHPTTKIVRANLAKAIAHVEASSGRPARRWPRGRGKA